MFEKRNQFGGSKNFLKVIKLPKLHLFYDICASARQISHMTMQNITPSNFNYRFNGRNYKKLKFFLKFHSFRHTFLTVYLTCRKVMISSSVLASSAFHSSLWRSCSWADNEPKSPAITESVGEVASNAGYDPPEFSLDILYDGRKFFRPESDDVSF